MESINDRFSIDKIKTGFNNFKENAISYLDGGMLIFIGDEELTETEAKFIDYLKLLKTSTVSMINEHLTFIELMEVSDYSSQELYTLLDNFKISYEKLIDVSQSEFMQSVEGMEDHFMLSDIVKANSAALKMTFITNASEIVFDNIQELHNRMKKFMDDNEGLF